MLDHLSASSMSLFETCPNAFYEKYVNGLVIDDTTDYYAKYGTLFHDICEGIAKGEIFYDKLAYDKFDIGFVQCGLPDKFKKEYYKQGKEGLKNKLEELGKLDIIGTEVKFSFVLEEGMPPIIGYIDLVYRDDKGRLIVRDYKTSKPYDNKKMKKQLQPYVYSIACEELYGEMPYMFEFDFVRFDKRNIVMINENFIRLGKIKLSNIWEGIKKNVPICKYNPFFCQNFCTCRSLCPKYLEKGGGGKW